jgi:uncharacterized protein
MVKESGMRSKILSLAIALFGLFTASAWAQAAADRKPVDAADRTARGTLYKVQHQGKTAYLFGTIHIGHPAFYPLDTQTMKALSESTRLVVEFDSRNNAAVMDALARYAFYPNGERIDAYLSVRTKQALRRTLPRFGLTFDKVAGMKPWMIANLLIGLDAQRDGMSLELGVENFLLEFANRSSKEVIELETADYQLALFDSMGRREQETYLQETLDEISSGEAQKKTEHLIRGWRTADSKLFEASLRELIAEKSYSAEFTRTVLLRQRNSEMAPRIATLLNEDGTSFIAVGLLHLVGEAGLPALLRKRGYSVQKLH